MLDGLDEVMQIVEMNSAAGTSLLGIGGGFNPPPVALLAPRTHVRYAARI
jgi:hypothetical protein